MGAVPEGDGWAPPVTHELPVGGGRVLRYCCYGPADGLPVVSLAGTPGTRWERPDVVTAFEQAGLRVAAPDRPGYGGSTRQPGRIVADTAADVQMIADAQGWPRFAVTGFSGGGPHALACAALLAGRVTCCAAVATPAPADATGVDFFADRAPGQAEDFRLALRGEQALRPYLQARAGDAMAKFGAGFPAPPSGPAQTSSSASSQPAADPGRTARIRAMFLGGLDGWGDDHIALVRPWGFDLASIRVPVSIWHGGHDSRVPRAHTDWLLAHLPSGHGREYPDGHDPSDASYRRILGWITATAGDRRPGFSGRSIELS
jgi:pimeloyl-ACP methyl ester carboxylesterase